ncbi:MAG: hypothetical protein H0X33_10535 [Taibaiella sp.]|nr:hypothetical protein [Taibaiella sp.]
MQLSETWFMEGYVDFELQKYHLLAYLQEVNKYFNETKLYPQLSDLILHYNNLVSFRTNKKLLQDQFPKRIDRLDMQNIQVIYEKMLADDAIMQELEQITLFAMDELKGTIENGAEIYDHLEKSIRIEPIGLLPLYKNEGYVLLRYGSYSEIRAYTYTVTLFEHQAARYKGLRIQYLDTWTGNIVNTYEQVKRDIIRSLRTIPTPAVYSIETPLHIPFDETLLPIAKRLLIRSLDAGKAA